MSKETIYQNLFEFALDAILVANDEGRYVDANLAACQMTGYSLEDLRQMTIWDLTPEADREAAREAWRRFREETYREGEYQIRREDGRLITVEYRAVADVSPGRHLSIMHDVTEQKQTEAELRREKKRLATLLGNLPGMVYRCQVKWPWTMYFVSQGCEALTGYRPHDLIDDQLISYGEIIHPDDVDNVKETVANAVAGGEPFQLRYRIRTQEGEQRWVWERGCQVRYEEEGSDTEPFLEGFITNVTEEVQAVQALQASERRFRMVLENLNLIAVMLDRNGRVTFANDYLLALTGWKREEALGRDWFAHFIPESIRAEVQTIFQHTVEGSALPSYYENEIVTRSGERRLIEWTNTTLSNAQGEVSGVTSIGKDVTRQRQAEQKSAQLAAVVEQGSESVIITDTEGAIEYVNPAFETITGYSAAEAVGETPRILKSGHQDDEFYRELWDTITTGHTWRGNFVNRRKDGSLYHEAAAIFPIKDESGRIVNYAAVKRDVTTRIRAERERDALLERIQEQAQQVRQIMNSVPDGVLLLDDVGRIRLTNRSADRYLELLDASKNSDVLHALGNRPLSDLLAPPPVGSPHEVSNNNHIFEIVSHPMQGGKTGGWVMVIREITQQREREKRAIEQQRLAAVGQLAAGIAHDFNNLIAVIVLYTQIVLHDTTISDEIAERLRTVETQAKRATDLINQILDFSRQSILKRQSLTLTPFVKEAGKLLTRTLPEHIQVVLDVKTEQAIVNADPTRIQQALMNLALNARDAMPEGGKLTISLEAIEATERKRPLAELESGPWVRLAVSDTGAGIPDDVLPHIYEPFFTTKAPGEGSGLGLAQVYGIAKQHEGHIDVQTRLGQGTTFFLYLPALTTPDRAAPAISSTDLPTGNGERILLVEDDQPTLITLQDSLKLLNYEPIAAPNGEIALEIIAQQGDNIDLIVSDAVMPQMGGRELLQRVRRQGLAIPFVIVSGHPLHPDQEEDLEAQGVDAWIAKPLGLHQLAQAIRTQLEKRRK